jgi:hypothetical protein
MTNELEANANEVVRMLRADFPNANPDDLMRLAYLWGLRDGNQDTIDRIDAMQTALERMQ